MKDEKHLHKMFGDILQKQMDADYIEVAQDEMTTGRKLQPGYEQNDVFDTMKETLIENITRQKEERRIRNNKLIHAHDPNKKIVMVMPNE